jgi:hypothetical protein
MMSRGEPEDKFNHFDFLCNLLPFQEKKDRLEVPTGMSKLSTQSWIMNLGCRIKVVRS